MTPAERERCGIRPLPGTLPDALAALAADSVLFSSLGGLLGPALIAIRTAEHEYLEAMGPVAARLAHLRTF